MSSLASVAALMVAIVLAVFVFSNVNQTPPAAPAAPPVQPRASNGVTQSVSGTIGALTFPIAVGDVSAWWGLIWRTINWCAQPSTSPCAGKRTIHEMTGYMVFVYVIDAQGNVVAQLDAVPTDGVRPTQSWQPGETIIDRHVLMLPVTAAPGQYAVLIGLYDRGVRERTSLGSDAIPAGTLYVSDIPHRLNVNLGELAALLGHALKLL